MSQLGSPRLAQTLQPDPQPKKTAKPAEEPSGGNMSVTLAGNSHLSRSKLQAELVRKLAFGCSR